MQSIYIYISEILSVYLSFTPITRLGLLRSTYQLPNTINPSFSYFKFVTASECGNQIAFYSKLKTKKWRKLKSNILLKTTAICSMGWANNLHSGGHRFEFSWWTDFFFENQYFLHTRLFFNLALITLLLGIPITHRNRRLNTRYLGTQICWLLIDGYFCSFITARWRHWCRGKTENSCHISVVHSCQ